MTEVDTLKQQVDQLTSQVVQLQLAELRKDVDDHEKRLRPVEEVATKFNLLLTLTFGGGLLSVINLGTLIYTISQIKP